MLSWNLICLSLFASLAQAAVVPTTTSVAVTVTSSTVVSSTSEPVSTTTATSPTTSSAPSTTVSTSTSSAPTTTAPTTTTSTSSTSSTTSTPPTSTPTPLPSFLIHPISNTNKCLDVRGAIFENGTPVEVFDCNGTPAQNWVLTPGETAVQLAGTEFCLDAGATPANGVGMKIWQCFDNLPAQDWFFTTDLRIALTNQGFCLDLTNGSTANGNQVQTWKCTDNDVNQIWVTSPGGSINSTTTSAVPISTSTVPISTSTISN